MTIEEEPVSTDSTREMDLLGDSKGRGLVTLLTSGLMEG